MYRATFQAACWLLLALITGVVRGDVITFEDIESSGEPFFSVKGLNHGPQPNYGYSGYSWGYLNSSEWKVPSDGNAGWALGTPTNPTAVGAAEGTQFAYNAFSPQSLAIDFHAARYFGGGYFAQLYPGVNVNNSTTIEILGYGETQNLVWTSGAQTLTNAYQYLGTGLGITPIWYLEIRGSGSGKGFAVDSLSVSTSPASVPEPSTLAMLAVGMLAIAQRFLSRKPRAS